MSDKDLLILLVILVVIVGTMLYSIWKSNQLDTSVRRKPEPTCKPVRVSNMRVRRERHDDGAPAVSTWPVMGGYDVSSSCDTGGSFDAGGCDGD